MQLRYNLDVEEGYQWLINTPNQDARKMLMYVTEIGHFRAGRHFFTERTGKKEYYMIYTVSGRGVMHHKGARVVLRRHEAICIYCEEHQYYASMSDEPWDHYWIHFNGPGAASYHDIISEGEVHAVHLDDAHAFVDNIESIMENSGAADMRMSLLNAMHLTNLLTMMASSKYSVSHVVTLTRHQDALTEAIDFIRERYALPITLDDIAGATDLSKYYFVKLFRQFTGMTPHEYLVNYRIDQAKKYLRTTPASISSIALQVGFTDASNFSRTFRRITGSSPQNFRKMRD